MKIHDTGFPGLYAFEPKVFGDERGYFLESYRASIFKELGLNPEFVQDNESSSRRGALRGMHFQKPPHAQGKLLRVVVGAIYDVVVDVRVGSPTYGKWYGIELSQENKMSIYVPEGFAHGFVCLQDGSIVQYKCTDYYNPSSEGGLPWNDPGIGIDWPLTDVILSEKDKHYKNLAEFESPFTWSP